METPIYGIAAEYDSPAKLLAAARAARDFGYRRFEAYAPYPVEGLDEIIRTRDPVPLMVLAGGLFGAAAGWALQNYIAIVQYPINVAGRPLFSWPAWVPVMFELTILFAAGAAFFGTLWLCGLPLLHHPVFNIGRFARASRDRFFLCIDARDPRFNRERTAEFLMRLGPLEVWDIDED